MKSLKKLLLGLLPLLALTFMACPPTASTPENVEVASVTFSVESGSKVSSGTTVTLSSATEGAVIYYTIDGTALNSSNFANAGTEYTAAISLVRDVTINAIAVFVSSSTGTTFTSEPSSATYTIAAVPVVTISTTATPDSNGNYALGTVFTISQTSEEENDTVTIYYSTSTSLTSANAETEGTVYGANSETDTTNLTLSETNKGVLNISAIAKGNNGWGVPVSLNPKIPITYKKGAYDFDGRIKTVITTINGSGSNVTLNSLEISGIVTRVSNSNIYIQDKDAGIQLYNSSWTTSEYAVGDYVTVSNITVGLVYGNTGTAEITRFNTTLVKDATKATRFIYFAEIPSYVKDFTDYVDNGNALLYGFRGTANEHTTAPDLIYGVSDDNKSTEKILIGVAVNSSASGIELSVWTTLDASDDILTTQSAPDSYIVAPKFSQNGGNISSGAPVNLTSVYPTDSEIYYQFVETSNAESTTVMTSENYSSQGTKYDSSNTETGVPKITADGTLYALAVKTVGEQTYVSRVASAKFTVMVAGSDVYDSEKIKTLTQTTNVNANYAGATLTGSNSTVALARGSNNTNVPCNYNGTGILRTYKNNTITISGTNGKKIKTVTFEFSNTNLSNLSADSEPTTLTTDSSLKTATWSPTTSVDSVVFTGTGSCQIKTITVVTE